MEEPVGVSRAGPPGQQHVGAPAQDEVDVDDLTVPAGRLGAGHQRVPLVVDLLAPEQGVPGERLVVDALRVFVEEGGEAGRGETGAVPHALDQQQPAARPQQ